MHSGTVLNSEHGPPKKRGAVKNKPPYTTSEVMRLVGCTYRKLDHWSRRGYIPGQEGGVGSGHRRDWTDDQIDRVRLLMMASEIKNASLDDLADRIAGHLECPLVA